MTTDQVVIIGLAAVALISIGINCVLFAAVWRHK